MTINKATILASDDFAYREIHVPQWGGIVRLKTLSCAEFETFVQLCRERSAGGSAVDIRGIRCQLVAQCLVDTDGNRLFSDSEEDLRALSNKSTAVLELLWQECRELNAFSDEALEDLAGN